MSFCWEHRGSQWTFCGFWCFELKHHFIGSVFFRKLAASCSLGPVIVLLLVMRSHCVSLNESHALKSTTEACWTQLHLSLKEKQGSAQLRTYFKYLTSQYNVAFFIEKKRERFYGVPYIKHSIYVNILQSEIKTWVLTACKQACLLQCTLKGQIRFRGISSRCKKVNILLH